MNRIDPSRIAGIFRTLATDSGKPAASGKKTESHTQSKQLDSTKEIKSHDENVLRQRLHKRLKRLYTEADNFLDLAPEVTIKEVLIWEFGDNILDHPEFNAIAKKVTQTVQMSENTSLHLKNLIQQLIDQ